MSKHPINANGQNSAQADVFILDDDHASALRIQATAVRAGLTVQVVDNFETLIVLLEHAPRTLVMELLLESVDGIEIIRHMAQMMAPPDIVIVTAADPRIADSARRLATAKGITVRAVLPKPLNEAQLHDALIRDLQPQAGQRGRARFVPSPLELRRGIANGEIEALFQPKIDVRTLELTGFEALARWSHPDHGAIGPDVFINVAERHDLIGPLTDSVLGHALRGAALWNDLGLDLRVAVNVSGASLANLTLPDHLQRTTQSHGLEPEQVTVEITEGWIAQNPIDALDILTRMRMKGFELSIDDFGSGYSSILRLKEAPFSELKLDQSLIRGAAADEAARIIANSSIELGQKLGLRVVAEGVDNQDDWDLIGELGCDEGQGYFIARPLSLEALPEWLAIWRRSLGHL